PRKNLRVILEQVRLPLVGLTTHEAIEVLEAHARRPLIEGAGNAVLEARRVVIFAEPRRRIAVLGEDPADGCVLRTDDRVIARVTRRQLRDHAEADLMMV